MYTRGAPWSNGTAWSSATTDRMSSVVPSAKCPSRACGSERDPGAVQALDLRYVVARADLGAPEDEHREVCRGHRLRNVSRKEGDHLLGVLGRELVNRQLEPRLVDDLEPLRLHGAGSVADCALAAAVWMSGSTRSPWAFQTPVAIIAETICFDSACRSRGCARRAARSGGAPARRRSRGRARVVGGQEALDDPAGRDGEVVPPSRTRSARSAARRRRTGERCDRGWPRSP